MTDDFIPDEPSYEDLDDAAWTDADDLDAIDLDKLDDAIEDEPPTDTATEGLFKTMDALATPKARPRKAVRAPVEEKAEAVEPPAPAVVDEQKKPDEKPAPRTRAPKGRTRKTTAGKNAPDPLAEVAPVAEAVPAAAAAPTPPAPVAEAAPALLAETATVSGTEEAPPGPPPPPPDLIFRVQLSLPPELTEQTTALRKTGEITAMPEPGIALVADFRATDPEAVKTALAAWVQKHLPMQLESTGVWAEVIGAQQFVAAWTLQPEKEVHAAQRSLNKALAPLITPLPDAPAEFPVRVVIGDQVAAARYPHVIAQMQRDFEPEVWHATELRLIQHPADAAPVTWETAATFD